MNENKTNHDLLLQIFNLVKNIDTRVNRVEEKVDNLFAMGMGMAKGGNKDNYATIDSQDRDIKS